MLKILDKLIQDFRPCFNHKATFAWFVIIIIGFIVRYDFHGVTSFIRWLFLEPQCYNGLLLFFRSNWSLDELLGVWASIVYNKFPIPTINDRPILVGDGIKICKEAKKMPGVKRLHQDSNNSGKGEIIFGHHINFIGIIIGTLAKVLCLPLHGRIHEGIDEVRIPEKFNGKDLTIVTKMTKLIIKVAITMNIKAYVTLDAYFAVGPAFLYLKEHVNEKGEQIVHLVTQAKKNYVGYHDREFANTRFHPNDRVPLIEWFEHIGFFETVQIIIYGELKTIKYSHIDLLWRPIKDWVRFVLVIDGDSKFILMSADLTLDPLEIIKIYSYRSRIESMFKSLKHILGGFFYHFWSKSCPKMKKGKIELTNLNESQTKHINQAIEANERFFNLAGITLGILHYISIIQPDLIWNSYQGWLRTQSSVIPSEEVVQNVLRVELFSELSKVPIYRTLQIVKSKMRKRLNYEKMNI